MQIGISVIIPTYNRDKSLMRALASVIRQTCSCDEIIIVDDGSTDDTCELVHSFTKTSPIPVQYVFQENLGPAAARNCGIRNAQFSHIAFLDSDDHWKKNKIEQQYNALQKNPEFLISHTKERWFRRGVHLNQKLIHQSGNGNIFAHCLQLCAVGMSTTLIKRELFDEIGLFDEGLRCCEDYDMWIRVSSRYPFLLIEQDLTVKEGGREDQVSFQYRVGMDKFRIRAILGLIRLSKLSTEQLECAIVELRRKCLVYGNGCVKHKRSEEGSTYLEIVRWTDMVMKSHYKSLVAIPDNPYIGESLRK